MVAETHSLVVVFGYVALWPRSALDAGCAGCLLLAGCWVYSWLPALLGDGALWPTMFLIWRQKPKGSSRGLQTGSSDRQGWSHLCRLPLPCWLLGV